MNDIRLLIVEEDPLQQFAMSELAQNFDYVADTVSTMDDALNFASRIQYAAILINTELENIDAFACSRRIRQNEKLTATKTPIIGLRSRSSACAKQDCIDSGMDDVLASPYSGEELRQVLLRWAYQSCHPNLKLLKNPNLYGHAVNRIQSVG